MSNATPSLGNHGPGVILDALGKEWSLSKIGPKIRAAYGAKCRVMAKQRLWAEREELDPQDYATQEQELLARIDEGHYDWGTPFEKEAVGPGVQATLDSLVGKLAFLQILLRAKHGDISLEQCLAIVEDNPNGMKEALQKVMSLDPNSEPPPG